MRVELQNCEGGCVVSVSGRIKNDSSPDLRALLLAHLNSPRCRSVTVDLVKVDYIDTSALAIFLETLRAARGLKKAFRLTGLQGRPQYLLEATGLMHLFTEVPHTVA